MATRVPMDTVSDPDGIQLCFRFEPEPEPVDVLLCVSDEEADVTRTTTIAAYCDRQ